jgi:hypothetical protein
LFTRGCFKISCSEKFYIEVTEFKYFETSLAGLLKQALLSFNNMDIAKKFTHCATYVIICKWVRGE